MLLPLLDCLSRDDQGGDGNVDFIPCFLPPVCFSPRSEETGTKHTNHAGKAGEPTNQVCPDGGWFGLVQLGKVYFERVPEHLRAMSVMPKRATWPPWAPTLLVELHKCNLDVGMSKHGTLFSDKGLNLSM